MIQPATYDLEPIIIGCTYDPGTLEILVDDVVKNLAGATITLEILSGEVVITTLAEADGLTVDDALGLISLLITDTDTETMTVGAYTWRLTIEESTGEIYRYIEGRVEVRK